MRETHPKFIIQNDQIVFGRVEYHIDLTKGTSPVSGGGWFHFDRDEKSVTLYGSSDQFGWPDPEKLIDLLRRREFDDISKMRFENYDFYYADNCSLYTKGRERALVQSVPLTLPSVEN